MSSKPKEFKTDQFVLHQFILYITNRDHNDICIYEISPVSLIKTTVTEKKNRKLNRDFDNKDSNSSSALQFAR